MRIKSKYQIAARLRYDGGFRVVILENCALLTWYILVKLTWDLKEKA